MIECQNCKSIEPDGAIFCSECGTQLQLSNAVQTQKFVTDTNELQGGIQYLNEIPQPNGAWVSLHLLESGHILAFANRNEFTLGRQSENQPIVPDVNLAPYKAFDNGVSRLHAVIRRIENNVILLDLGSSNGTYINGIRIMPNVEHTLRHGDIIALGKLKMQIVLS